MTKYVVPIDGWVSVDANSALEAWEIANKALSEPMSIAINSFGNGNIQFCEPEIDIDYKEEN